MLELFRYGLPLRVAVSPRRSLAESPRRPVSASLLPSPRRNLFQMVAREERLAQVLIVLDVGRFEIDFLLPSNVIDRPLDSSPMKQETHC